MIFFWKLIELVEMSARRKVIGCQCRRNRMGAFSLSQQLYSRILRARPGNEPIDIGGSLELLRGIMESAGKIAVGLLLADGFSSQTEFRFLLLVPSLHCVAMRSSLAVLHGRLPTR